MKNIRFFIIAAVFCISVSGCISFGGNTSGSPQLFDYVTGAAYYYLFNKDKLAAGVYRMYLQETSKVSDPLSDFSIERLYPDVLAENCYDYAKTRIDILLFQESLFANKRESLEQDKEFYVLVDTAAVRNGNPGTGFYLTIPYSIRLLFAAQYSDPSDPYRPVELAFDNLDDFNFLVYEQLKDETPGGEKHVLAKIYFTLVPLDSSAYTAFLRQDKGADFSGIYTILAEVTGIELFDSDSGGGSMGLAGRRDISMDMDPAALSSEKP